MRYGSPHITERIGALTLERTLKHVNGELQDAKIVGASGHISRSTKVAWIKDKEILSTFLEYTQAANKNAGWDFHLDVSAPWCFAPDSRPPTRTSWPLPRGPRSSTPASSSSGPPSSWLTPTPCS